VITNERQQEQRHPRRFVMMKTVFKSLFLGGVVILFLSSCATAPTEPLDAGGVRLLKVRIPEFGAIKKNLQYGVNFSFESAGEIEVRRACFFWSGDGPYCFPVKDVWYGSPGTITTVVQTPIPGMYSFEGYVLYVKDGRTVRSNQVSTTVEVTK
jgi:hypothetical protein